MHSLWNLLIKIVFIKLPIFTTITLYHILNSVVSFSANTVLLITRLKICYYVIIISIILFHFLLLRQLIVKHIFSLIFLFWWFLMIQIIIFIQIIIKQQPIWFLIPLGPFGHIILVFLLICFPTDMNLHILGIKADLPRLHLIQSVRIKIQVSFGNDFQLGHSLQQLIYHVTPLGSVVVEVLNYLLFKHETVKLRLVLNKRLQVR